MTCLRISVRHEIVAALSLPEVESRCAAIHDLMTVHHRNGVFAGMELIVEANSYSLPELIAQALGPSTLAAIAVLPGELVPPDVTNFALRREGNVIIARHQHAAQPLHLM